jgi:hypothetical protein
VQIVLLNPMRSSASGLRGTGTPVRFLQDDVIARSPSLREIRGMAVLLTSLRISKRFCQSHSWYGLRYAAASLYSSYRVPLLLW